MINKVDNSFYLIYLLFTSFASFALFAGLTWEILFSSSVGVWQGILCFNLMVGNGIVAFAITIYLFGRGIK